MGERLRLPAGHEFSPGQVEILDVLKIVDGAKGDLVAIREALRRRYFAASAPKYSADPERRKVEQTKRAGNILIGMQCYGLFNSKSAALTTLGQQLLGEPDPEARMKAFAEYILKHLHGVEALAAITTLRKRGETVTKATLHEQLEREGFDLPRATTHHLTMVAWLRQAGVFRGDKGYVVDEAQFERVLGTPSTTLSELHMLGYEKRVFLKTLYDRAKTSPPGHWFQTKEILAASVYRAGNVFPHGDTLRRTLFNPLEAEGWVEFDKLTEGRGGKSGNVRPTAKLTGIEQALLREGSPDEIPQEIKAALVKETVAIYGELNSSDRNIKGLALEALAVRLVSDLGLEPVRLRERTKATGGAEVDVIADGVGLHYSRWLCQCKNTALVTVSDLAKEIGMATLLKAQVILMVTTGTFAETVRQHANELAQGTPIQAVLLDGDALRVYIEKGAPALLERMVGAAAVTRDSEACPATSGARRASCAGRTIEALRLEPNGRRRIVYEMPVATSGEPCSRGVGAEHWRRNRSMTTSRRWPRHAREHSCAVSQLPSCLPPGRGQDEAKATSAGATGHRDAVASRWALASQGILGAKTLLVLRVHLLCSGPQIKAGGID